jgi:hypothetical protein
MKKYNPPKRWEDKDPNDKNNNPEYLMGFMIVTIRDELRKVVEVLPEIMPEKKDFITGKHNYRGDTMIHVVVPSTIGGFNGYGREYHPELAREHILGLLDKKESEQL